MSLRDHASEVVRMSRSGMSTAAIADWFGVSAWSVDQQLRRHRGALVSETSSLRNVTAEDTAVARALLAQDWPLRKVANHLNVLSGELDLLLWREFAREKTREPMF